MKTKKYDPHILSLLTTPGYISYFHKILSEYTEYRDCNRRAFEATERAYTRYFNRNKYSSYESFKSALGRFNKQKNKK